MKKKKTKCNIAFKTCNDAGFSMVAKNLSSLIESENRSLISAIFRALLWCAWVCASLSSRLRFPWLTIVSLTNGPRTCRGTTEPETSGPGWPLIWLAVLTKTLKRPVRSGWTKIVETSWRGSSPVVASYFWLKYKKSGLKLLCKPVGLQKKFHFDHSRASWSIGTWSISSQSSTQTMSVLESHDVRALKRLLDATERVSSDWSSPILKETSDESVGDGIKNAT